MSTLYRYVHFIMFDIFTSLKYFYIYKNEITFLSQELEMKSTTAGHFPPNSKVTGVRFLAAAVITIWPTLGPPINYHPNIY